MNKNVDFNAYLDINNHKNIVPNVSFDNYKKFVTLNEKNKFSDWVNMNVYSKDIKGVNQIMEDFEFERGNFSCIQDWQKELLNSIKDNPNTNKVYLFCDACEEVWIAVNNSSTEQVRYYMDLYAQYLIQNEKYFNIYVFDIMDEDDFQFSENTIILKRN